MAGTYSTADRSIRLYSLLWLFNGREEWEDYVGTREGVRRWIRETFESERADALIRFEEGDIAT
jgi:hypothetical protein